MGAAWSDLRCTLRSIATRTGVTAVGATLLALGIGLSSAIFALADPFLLRPLPYTRPDELVSIEFRIELDKGGFRALTLDDLRHQEALFTDVAAYRLGEVLRVRTPAGSVALQTAEVTENLTALLGVAAPTLQGRGRNNVETYAAITANAHARFPQSSLPGQGFPLHDGRTLRIVSELPSSFLFPRAGAKPRVDALVVVEPSVLIDVRGTGGSYGSRPFTVIARVRPGIAPAAVANVLRGQMAGDSRELSVDVQWLSSAMRRPVRPLALGAAASTVLILMMCAANLANLLLVRTLCRTREFATRRAVGAGQWDLVRLIGFECVALAAAGAIFGLMLAEVALTALRAVIPAEYAALGAPATSPRVIIFACLTAAAVTTIASIPMGVALPVAWRRSAYAAMRTDSSTLSAVRFGFAAVQSALAIILLCGASLLVRSYINLMTQSTGFRGDVEAPLGKWTSTPLGN